MGRFRNSDTGIVVSVDDSKDGRFVAGWVPADAPQPAEVKRSPGRPKKAEA